MNPSGARYDAMFRAELAPRWVRHARSGAGMVIVAAVACWFTGLTPDLWLAAVIAGCMLVASVVHRPPSPTWMVFTAAVAALALAPVGPPVGVETTTMAVMVGGVTALAVFEPRRRGMVLVAVLIGLGSAALILARPGWATGVALAPVVGASLLSVLLVSTVRSRLAERGAAVASREQRYRELFERIPVGLYRTGLGGEVLDANQALLELLGATRSEVLGKPIQPFLVDPEDLDRLRQRILNDDAVLVTDLRFRRRDGSVIWVRDHTRPVRDESGAIECFEGELADITEQVEHLERLQAAVRSKSELIAAVSHELRTPLTAVVGYLDLLAAGPIEDATDMLAIATEQVHEVAAIVEDLLTAARLDNRELVVHTEPVDVVAAIRSAIRSVGNPHALLTLPLELHALGDAARVRQILRNLISNAYRYGRPPVGVQASGSADGVSIVVADGGPAIPADVAQQMFEPFFTTGAGLGQPGAIGLGLAVSRQLARRMGGDLRHDRVGSETRFTLELPAAAGGTRAA